jgi:hypothetical protein
VHHRPEGSRVGGYHRLGKFLFPGRNEGHGREIAAWDDETVDPGAVDAGEGVAGVLGAELADHVRVGGGERLRSNYRQTEFALKVMFGALDDGL